jgi:hypothetical protein
MRPKQYWVVNAGRGRSSTHIMHSRNPSTPRGVATQLAGFGSNAKTTLCGLTATRHVGVFGPAQASCRECKQRWRNATAAPAAPAPEPTLGQLRARYPHWTLWQALDEASQPAPAPAPAAPAAAPGWRTGGGSVVRDLRRWARGP